MEHQYPGAISGDENMLAELMLPDQAHVRHQDWTIFFLHKDTDDDEEEKEAQSGEEISRQQKGKGSDDGEGEADGGNESSGTEDSKTLVTEEEGEEIKGGEGPPLVYVLNLVITKQDSSAKRSCPFSAAQTATAHLTFSQGGAGKSHGGLYTTLVPSHLQGRIAKRVQFEIFERALIMHSLYSCSPLKNISNRPCRKRWRYCTKRSTRWICR